MSKYSNPPQKLNIGCCQINFRALMWLSLIIHVEIPYIALA